MAMESQSSFFNVEPNLNNNSRYTSTVIQGDNHVVHVTNFYQGDGSAIHFAVGASKNDAFYKAISGNADVIELLIKAVNNRTVERNYFKLYCEMLDSSITEDEFDKIIKANESDYVIDETDEPDEAKIKTALELIKQIKGVNSMNDFTSLFSFNPKKLAFTRNQKERKSHT
jgi:predicted nucleotidyltransferase component of viral defense system